MTRADLQWTQFRRLLLGTVLESLLDQGARVEFSSIAIDFSDQSRFHVPRFNNYMRFVGTLTADLAAPLSPAAPAALERALMDSWHELLKSIELPVGDSLTNEDSSVQVVVVLKGAAWSLTVSFDLEAD